ncbi:MAG: ATP-binding protein [Thermaceae bacterium]|nr:ATP-binding protein [Thermaceae bacterium]
MRVHSLYAKNYGPYKELEKVQLGPLATIVGQNDAGKSTILRALQLFFDSRKIEENDVHDRASANDDVVIEVAFTSLPTEIELEDGITTTFREENLLDANGYLRIRKTYRRSNLAKFDVSLITHDFEDDNYAGLAILKEKELNERCASAGIKAEKSGRANANKPTRVALREKARNAGIQLVERELILPVKDDMWKKISALLPEFVLFETDTRLGIGESLFQSQFRPIVKTAAEQPDVISARDTFTALICQALQGEIDKIFTHLRRHTDVFTDLTVQPDFSWDKAVTLQVFGKDQYDVENSLDRRGTGIRRLLMVAFFQYLAEREQESNGNFIFAIEEPENCLHPGLQRELVTSFRKLADEGYQVIITSHSPVFAGASSIEDLALVVRNAGVARAIQSPELDLADVATQLGVEPSDQITGYHACIFVEGPSDIEFWNSVARKFKESGHTTADFEDRKIGFVLSGGDTLKYWINTEAMGRLNRRFGVIVDSDRESPQHITPGRKLNWKQKCESQGGLFYILRKREIENYLHPRAIERSGRTPTCYNEFSDMKKLFGENVYKVIQDMSCEEILEMDKYVDGGVEHHELLEVVQELLRLADSQ